MNVHFLFPKLGITDDETVDLLRHYLALGGKVPHVFPPTIEEQTLFRRITLGLPPTQSEIVESLFDFKWEHVSGPSVSGTTASVIFDEAKIPILREVFDRFKEDRDALSYLVHLVEYQIETELSQSGL